MELGRPSAAGRALVGQEQVRGDAGRDADERGGAERDGNASEPRACRGSLGRVHTAIAS